MPFRCPYGDYLSTWIRTPVEEDLEFFVERERERERERVFQGEFKVLEMLATRRRI